MFIFYFNITLRHRSVYLCLRTPLLCFCIINDYVDSFHLVYILIRHVLYYFVFYLMICLILTVVLFLHDWCCTIFTLFYGPDSQGFYAVHTVYNHMFICIGIFLTFFLFLFISQLSVSLSWISLGGFFLFLCGFFVVK